MSVPKAMDPVTIALPPIDTVPKDSVIAVLPKLIPVNCGESFVPNPRAVAAADAVVCPVPPFVNGTVPERLFGSSTVRPVATPVPPLATGTVPIVRLPAFSWVRPVVTPVPPSPIPNSPVIDGSFNLSASLPFSIAKPPFAFVSTDNECDMVSPVVAPVLAIPSPPVIVAT